MSRQGCRIARIAVSAGIPGTGIHKDVAAGIAAGTGIHRDVTARMSYCKDCSINRDVRIRDAQGCCGKDVDTARIAAPAGTSGSRKPVRGECSGYGVTQGGGYVPPITAGINSYTGREA